MDLRFESRRALLCAPLSSSVPHLVQVPPPRCRLLLSIKKIFGRDWATVTVRVALTWHGLAISSFPVPAPEEFDRLLFEFGLELDEDVRGTSFVDGYRSVSDGAS